jgi:DNA-binding SARP family transcriptional activator
MYVQGKAAVVGRDAIKFTLQETRALVERQVPMKLDEGSIESLHTLTDGWVAGLLLSTRNIGHEDIRHQFSDQASLKSMFDYFASEIFRKEDTDTRKFLLTTSFLPAFTVKEAEVLTGNHKSEKILKALSRECCFLRSYPSDNTVYQYHPLFREFLISRAKNTLHKEKLTQIKRDAAAVIENNGSVEDAVRLLKETGDVVKLIGVIQKWAPSMVYQGRYQTLLSWIEIVPEGTLLMNAWLLYWMGICYLPFQPDKSQSYFKKAFDGFSSQKEASGVFLTWTGIVESIIFGREGMKPLDQWAEVLEKLLDEYKGFPSEEIEVDVTCSVFRMLNLRKPLYFDANKWLARIHAMIEKSTDMPRKIKLLTSLAGYLYSQGNFRTLEVILGSMQELLKRYEVSPLVRLTVDWVRAAFFNINSQYDDCRRIVSEGIELANTLKIRLMEYLLLGHGVMSSLKEGDNATAKQHLQRMASGLGFIKPWEAGFYHYCAAWEALYQKNIAEARTHSEICLNMYQDIGNPWTLTIAHLLRAYVCHVSGDTPKAMKHLSEARSLGIKTGNLFTAFICSLSETYFYLQQGKEKAALESVRKGLSLGKENGFINLFMWLPGVLETTLTKALDHGIEEEYARKLIRANGLFPDRHHAISDRWPWPIKIHTLGRFGLLKDGIPVQFTGKIPQKPLAMLKAIIAFGGREVSEERLTDILWPDTDGDAAHSAFATTLSRLRQFLGNEKVIGFHDGKAMLDTRHCWVDVWAFERLLGAAFSLWERGVAGCKQEDAMILSERAIKMYTGPFLSGENEPWIVSIRERLRSRVLRLIKVCGNYYEQSGNLEKALECYQRGLEVDDLIEEFYQRMMKCNSRLGRRAEALSVYKRCSHVLSSVLGIRPSEETEALARELKK